MSDLTPEETREALRLAIEGGGFRDAEETERVAMSCALLLARADRAEKALRILADPEGWHGDPTSLESHIFGHFTPFEIARDALRHDEHQPEETA